MIEILLIIALVISIAMDIVRIRQYQLTMGKNKTEIIKEVAKKVRYLYGRYLEQTDFANFEDYAVKHWEDED